VGINVEAQKDGFWQATQGMGNYVFTMNTYTRDVEYNELTKPFIDICEEIRGDAHLHRGHLYGHQVHGLAPAIEKVGTLDPDKLVAFMEDSRAQSPRAG
jgi:branched-chain amino acid transport system substrate-binding protein